MALGLLLAALLVTVVAPAASLARTRAVRLTLQAPATAFVKSTVMVNVRSSDRIHSLAVVIERHASGRYQRLAGGPTRSGQLSVRFKAPMNPGRLVIRARLSARGGPASKSATVTIRPLPVVVNPSAVISVPPPGQGGWIRLRLSAEHARMARAASGADQCLAVLGLSATANVIGNFIAIGYGQRSKDGYLGKIEELRWTPYSFDIHTTDATLDRVLGDTPVNATLQNAINDQRTFTQALPGAISCKEGGSFNLQEASRSRSYRIWTRVSLCRR